MTINVAVRIYHTSSMSVIHYMYGSKRRYLRYLMFSLGNSPRVSASCVARSADSYRFRAHTVKCTYCLHEVRIPLSKSSLIQLTSIGSGKYFCEEGAASAKSKSRIDYYFLERRMSREHSEGRKEGRCRKPEGHRGGISRFTSGSIHAHSHGSSPE